MYLFIYLFIYSFTYFLVANPAVHLIIIIESKCKNLTIFSFLFFQFFLFLACEDLNKEVESSTSSSTSSSLEKPLKEHRAGSVIVHECCADYMAKCRHIALGRAKRVEVCSCSSFSLI